jgi:hypothetical protein
MIFGDCGVLLREVFFFLVVVVWCLYAVGAE